MPANVLKGASGLCKKLVQCEDIDTWCSLFLTLSLFIELWHQVPHYIIVERRRRSVGLFITRTQAYTFILGMLLRGTLSSLLLKFG